MMGALVRLALIVAVGLLAAGTQVSPHDHAAGWTHEGLDHPPSAVHATLLEHLRYLAARSQAAPATPTGSAFAAAPAVSSAGAIVLAVLAFAAPRPWRPSRLGVARLAAAIAPAQRAPARALRPPRPSSSSSIFV
jgi:hypothetical protein